MRQLSKRTQYSLRALYALTRKFGRGPVLITTLAASETIPKKFLEQILVSLKSAGFVASKKGKGGGYALAQPPENITIGSVIRAIEGPLAPLPCASETRFRKCDECVDIQTCGTRIIMRQVRDAVAAILDETTLAMVCDQVDAAKTKKTKA
ncbi:MAG TPA: Rrf2 family transcriptional regulator [Bryobacteraceae bacterium]|nr:Rrf2 family transcriptional regulator [Bryobacteraceae bacterium]